MHGKATGGAELRSDEVQGTSSSLLIQATDLARQVVEACRNLTASLAPTYSSQPTPPGVRLEILGLSAVLPCPSWDEVIRWATNLQVDLRDINERELAFLERVSVKLVQKWRTDGTGPAYRKTGGIRYGVRDYWEWRRRGRQTITGQRASRRGLDD